LALINFTASHFRCFEQVKTELDPASNLIIGPNASGKTSLLEAIAYLGRGKSFRGAPVQKLVSHGETEFILYGETQVNTGTRRIGVRNGRNGQDVRIDGESATAAALAHALPLQIIDPDVHEIVGGAPDARRRHLDWLGFHVEPGYLSLWQRFRRALKQRNVVLKALPDPAELQSWDIELSEAGEKLDELRAGLFSKLRPFLDQSTKKLLEGTFSFEYRRGWSNDMPLSAALEAHRDRDLSLTSTSIGPQRADLAVKYDDRQARKLVSRGQQKLLACAMTIAAVQSVQASTSVPLLLLLDDPAAELDELGLKRLIGAVEDLNCQIVATALHPITDVFQKPTRLFHVKHGELSNADS